MNEYLGMLLVGGFGSWEVRIYGGLVAAAGWFLQLSISHYIQRRDAAQAKREKLNRIATRTKHADHIRLIQHDQVIVEKLLGGVPFPNLCEDEESD